MIHENMEDIGNETLSVEINFREKEQFRNAVLEYNYDSDDDGLVSYFKNKVKNEKLNLLELSKYAAACVRLNVSERAGAELANALLEDITEDNSHLVIDCSKIRRQKKIIGREITQEAASTEKI